MYDPQVFFDPHGVQVLNGHSLQFEGIMLEIFKTIPKKDRVSRIYLLNAILIIKITFNRSCVRKIN